MILTVDVGNTTIALAGVDSGFNVRFCEKFPSDKNFREPIFRAAENFPPIKSAVLSSVVPTLTEPVCNAVSQAFGAVPAVISEKMCRKSLKFAVPNPEKIGLDRIADSVWAARFPLPVVTVDLGTAATFNVIGKGGVFLGGIISAGIKTSVNALSLHAAQLSQIDLSVPENVIGKNTLECMLSGAVIGTAAMIEGIISRVEKEISSPVTTIITGGDADLVKPFLPKTYIFEPFLLAKGLAAAAYDFGKIT